jgi:HK97 gp10 family phage protein
VIIITDNHGPRLRRLTPEIVAIAMGEEIEVGARFIAEDAADSIRADSISGKGHVPSAPGAPPNADTHDLDQSIHVAPIVETPGVIQSGVIADSDHAYFLERGTSRMAARPFLEPATERQRPDLIEAIVKRFRAIVGL